MEVFRLVKTAYANQLSGKGAALFGARWNSIGTELVYTAANRSLAMAEVLVNLALSELPTDMVMLTIQIPNKLGYAVLEPKVLPPTWNRFPPTTAAQLLGDQFVQQGAYCLLQVPSVVTQGDFNYLINPAHADFSLLILTDIRPFPFDQRLLRSPSLS